MPQLAIQKSSISKKRLWAGWIIGGLPAVFVLVSGVNLMLVQSPGMVESFAKFGYPANLIVPIGILEFVCALIYMIPRTAIFGALLLTAYMGGATATHVRISDPTGVVPVVGILIWVGLYLRDTRLAALFSLRSPQP